MAWLTQIFMLYILVIKIQGRIIYDNCDDECTRNKYPLLRRTYKELYESRLSDEDCTSGCQESDADLPVLDDCNDICGKNNKLFFRNCPRNKKCLNKKANYPFDYYKHNPKDGKTNKHHYPDCKILKHIRRLPKNHYCFEKNRGKDDDESKDDNKSKDNKPKVSGKSIDNDKTSFAKNNTPPISSNKDSNKPKGQSDATDQNTKPESNNVIPNNGYTLVEVPNNEEYYNPSPIYTSNYVPAYEVSYPIQYYTVPLSSSLIPVNTGQVYSYIPSVSQNVGNPIIVAPTPEIVSPSISNAQIYVPSNCTNNGDQIILVPENAVNSNSCNNDGKVYVLKEDTSKEGQPAQNNKKN